ncbi:hypothetical protein NQZ68_001304 [Dissostichus eleginoides]|nr:hypothetical protein NQZ68_001304 [Dissostichus eleginoides]
MGHSEMIPQSNCLLSTLASCPPPLLPPSPLPPWHQRLKLEGLVDPGRPCSWRGATDPPSQRSAKSVLTKTKWRNLESWAVP